MRGAWPLLVGLVRPEGIDERPKTDAESQSDRGLSNIKEREHGSLLVYRERIRIDPREFRRMPEHNGECRQRTAIESPARS